MKQFSQHKCEVKIRPEYEGRKARPERMRFNGEVHAFEVAWHQDDGDPYPGEHAMVIVDDDERLPWSKAAFGWISSGDLHFLSENDK